MKIINRKFSREYQEIERFEAGLVLSGPEVKVIRAGGLRLEGAYVRLIGDEAYLVNAELPRYRFAKQDDYDPKHSRKLLLHKKEIIRIQTKLHGSGGLTLVPVSCYNKGDLLKLEIALVRGRRDVEKRKLEKKKEIERQAQRELKQNI